VKVDGVWIINLGNYVQDVETPLSGLIFGINYPDNAVIDGSMLTITFQEVGEYAVQLSVTDGDNLVKDTFMVIVTDGDTIDTSDVDGDGLPNYWEKFYGLDPNDPSDAQVDLDDDTLTNLQEFELGTDPNRADTDFDGINDNLDENPTVSDLKAKPQNDGSEDDNIFPLVIIIILIVVLIVGILASLMVKNRNKRDKDENFNKPFDSDDLIRQIRDEIMQGERTAESEISDAELSAILEKNYQNKQISEDTYMLVAAEELIGDP